MRPALSRAFESVGRLSALRRPWRGVGVRWDGTPPEEAYGRVTDPGRYARLHEVGRDLLDGLESRFVLTARNGCV
jgi:hypothetical protein